MKSRISSAIFFLLSSVGFAQTPVDNSPSPFPSVEKPARTFKFEYESRDKKLHGEGTLKLIETKNFVQLEFEANGLRGGNYEILQTQNCKSAKHSFSAKKLSGSNEPLFAFKTQYGDISSESKLESRKLSDLGIEQGAVALIKVENHKKTLVACAQE